MKKLLAAMMVLAMLLSACAFAEETDVPAGVEFTLGDIVVFEGDNVMLDLTGLGVTLGVYDGENSGVQIALNAQEQEVLALNLAIAEDGLLLGMTGVSDVYSVDFETIRQNVNLNVSAAVNMDGLSTEISSGDQAALMALAFRALTLVQMGMSDGGTEEIEGETYNVTYVEVPKESVQPLLEELVGILDNYSEVLADSGVESFTGLYETLTPTVGLSGTIFENEDGVMAEFTLDGTAYDGRESGSLILYLEGAMNGEESAEVYLETGVLYGDMDYTLAFNLDLANGNDGSWLPASDAPVDLVAALEDETQSQKLMLEAMSAAMGALSRMAAANDTVAMLLNVLMTA